MTPPFITADAVAGQLDWLAVADAIAAGHRGPRAALGDLFLSEGGDTVLSRAAWIPDVGMAVKTVSVLPGNPAEGRPTVHGAMIVFDAATGAVRAVIDSALVTRWKTAADSILGARLLARPDATRLLIVGTGSVAESLTEAYPAAFPGIEIEIWGRTPAKAAALAARTGARAVDDLEAAVARADIVATATMARAPILEGAWLRPGQHLDLIGAFTAEMREVDDKALCRARIFVDSYDTTLAHIGELKDPLARGVIARADILGDFYALVGGAPGRRAAEDITLFKNGGGAHLDLMTAGVILAAWERAKSQG